MTQDECKELLDVLMVAVSRMSDSRMAAAVKHAVAQVRLVVGETVYVRLMSDPSTPTVAQPTSVSQLDSGDFAAPNTSNNALQRGDSVSILYKNSPQDGWIACKLGTQTPAFNVDKVYPVGSIYMSVNNTSPATLFGGTWQQIQDTFLLAAGSTYEAGSTGGEATHMLSVSELPSHTHYENIVTNAGIRPWAGTSASSGTGKYVNLQEKLSVGSNDDESKYVRTGSTGSGDAHNNMPPYLAVYMWRRTA